MAQKEAIMRALMEALSGSGAPSKSIRPKMRPEGMPMRPEGMPMRPKGMPMRPKGMPMRPKMRPMDVTPEAERGDSDLMRMVNGMKKGGVVKKKAAKKPAKKSKNGCVMAGRGGKYKGMR